MIKSWSLSALQLYEQCPKKYYLEKIKKVPVPSSPALERGIDIHAKAEGFLKGTITGLPNELQKFKNEFENLKKHGAIAEEELTLDRHWQPVPNGWNDPRTWLRGKTDARIGDWVCDFKGLPLNTPIPTPSGWTTMKDVQVGDELFDMRGKVCKVLNKSNIKNLPNYVITFDDATTIQCDQEHLWTLIDGSVKCVTELRRLDKIPVAEPIDLPDVELPIAPYLFGHWLGDGRVLRSEITSNGDDVGELIEHFNSFYETVGKVSYDYRGSNSASYSPVGLRSRLNKLGVIGDKHIPNIYMRASIRQRLELLQGLIDSDGSINTFRKQVVYCSTSERLIDSVHELILSLGQRAIKSSHTYSGFGKTGIAYRLSFRPRLFVPTLLKRKADLVDLNEWNRGKVKNWYRSVKNVEEVPATQSQCIEVDSDTHTFLCGEQFCVTHNTGRKYDKHEDQARLYATILMQINPDFESVDVEFWYLDSGDIGSYEFFRSGVEDDIAQWEDRVAKLFREKTWLPKENQYCRWCPHQKDCELFR